LYDLKVLEKYRGLIYEFMTEYLNYFPEKSSINQFEHPYNSHPYNSQKRRCQKSQGPGVLQQREQGGHRGEEGPIAHTVEFRVSSSAFVLIIHGEEGWTDLSSAKCWEMTLIRAISILVHSLLEDAYKQLPIEGNSSRRQLD
jgi:hypothetical protein